MKKAGQYTHSIVVPVLNEEKVLKEFYRRLVSVMDPLQENYEIIFVNDGSKDKSFEIMKEINQKDNQVKIINLSRNFGHQIAISAGLDYASGNAVVIMDADLQHPPEIIPSLIEKWKKGYEIVHTVREYTKKENLFKKFTSSMFYTLINKIGTGGYISANSPDFKLIDRKAVDSLNSLREKARFVRGLLHWIGFNSTSVSFVAEARYAGKTKYSFKKMLKFAFDGITSFSTLPLRVASYLGLAVSFSSFIYILYAAFIKLFTNKAITGWTSTIIMILFLGGIQLITIGIVGEYLGRIYDEVKQRPLYLVSDKIGFNERER